jgi:SRSO17 transposase
MIQDLMTGGASIEDTLAFWAASLRAAKQRMRPLFTQDRVAASANQFLDALLSNEPRKTGWMRAEAAGDSGPWRQQALLGRGRWDADALRDVVREFAVEYLGGSVAKFARSQIVHDGGAFMLPFGTRRKRRLLELSCRFHLSLSPAPF